MRLNLMETSELALSAEERVVLHALAEDTSVRARRRAHILLEWADGQNAQTIARELASRPGRIARVIAAFQVQRLAIFSAAARKRVGTPPQAKPAPTKPALTAQTSMRKAARQILGHQFAKLKQTEAAVRAAEDMEAVHDMRVATRRMNSAFRLFKKYLPKKRTKKLLALLEELRDLLGDARNLDVLSADLETYRGGIADSTNAQLLALGAQWRSERESLQDKLVRLLDSPAFSEWCERMESFCETAGQDSTPRGVEVLPALLWQQYGAVRAYDLKMEHATLQELHALRIALKRLRYTLEFFRDPLRSASDETKTGALIDPIIDLQDCLGLIQDAVVAGQHVTDFLTAQADDAKHSGQATPEFQQLAAYHAHLYARIDESRAQLPEKWAVVIGPAYRTAFAQAIAAL